MATGATNPVVVNPLMWPSFHRPWARKLNRTLLARQLHSLETPGGGITAVTTLPIVADLIGQIEADRWVYYCVDDLSQWPGLDSASLQSMERDLVRRVDAVIAASQNLAERLQTLGRPSTLLTHGIDLDFWSSTPRQGVPDPLGAEDAAPPYVVFWGVIDKRLDVGFLQALNDRLEAGSVLLIGPQNDPDPALQTLSNVHLLGPRPFQELPFIAQQASVMIMPYARIPVNHVLQPLKFKEYLATGKPTVVSALPAVVEWSDCCDIARDPEEFATLVTERLASGPLPEQTAARERLHEESWQAKTHIFESVLFD